MKSEGKVDSRIQRLNKLVIGRSKVSKQDFKSVVGRKSRGQVELDVDRMAHLTSSSVTKGIVDSIGGGLRGSECGENESVVMLAVSLVTLSEKNCMKLLASEAEEVWVGMD